MQACGVIEDRLLLLLMQGELSPQAGRQALDLLAAPLRWEWILDRATAEEVYPLLYRGLRRLDFLSVPSAVRAKLDALYKVNAFRNARLSEELARALKLLAGGGIAAIPFKGITLAESLYGDTALRVCADIDLLVPREAALQAAGLLVAGGYQVEFTERFFFDLLLRSDIECALVRDEREFSYALELHWGILWGWPRDRLAIEEMWREAQPNTCLGVPTKSLSAEWQLLLLAAHAARHRWQTLKWLVDIHALCSNWRIDWETVSAKARDLDWEDVLRITMSACHALFDTPSPSRVRAALPAWLKLFPAAPPASWRDAFFLTRLLRRPVDKARYIAKILFVPTLAERRFLRLPARLSYLYYPMRPLRLVGKRCFSFLRGDLAIRN